MRVVSLPRTLDENTMYEVIRNVLNNNLRPYEETTTFDFAGLRFIRAQGVAFLSNLLEYLKKHDASYNFVHHDDPTDANKFLDDSLFFHEYLGRCVFDGSNVRNTTVTLKKIEHNQSFDWLQNKFIPWLADHIGVSQAKIATLKMPIWEIFNNIKDHSGEQIGCLFLQYYPNEHQIIMAISDFGVGIPHNVRKRINDISDEDTLKEAIREGFSTGRPNNRGAGLDNLIRFVTLSNKGDVSIHSGKGILTAAEPKRNPAPTISSQTSQIAYPGTLIILKLKTDTFDMTEDSIEEFEW